MTLQTTKLPYEFLARWGADGRLQGCHVQWRYVVSDDNTTVSESLGDAEGVTSATSYPLSELLSALQTAAIKTAGDVRADLEVAQARVVRLEQALQEQTERASVLAEQLTNAQQRLPLGLA